MKSKEKHFCKCGKEKKRMWGICEACELKMKKNREARVKPFLEFAEKKIDSFNLKGIVSVRHSYGNWIHLECSILKNKYDNMESQMINVSRKDFEYLVEEFLMNVARRINESNRELLFTMIINNMAEHKDLVRFRRIESMVKNHQLRWREGERR